MEQIQCWWCHELHHLPDYTAYMFLSIRLYLIRVVYYEASVIFAEYLPVIWFHLP